MSITEFAFKRPVTVLMVFTSVIILGWIASSRIPLAFMPEFTGPGLWIEIPYPGSTPEEVERLVVKPAEEVLATVSGVKNIRSWSRESGGGIQVEFTWGDNVELKALEAKEKLDGIRSQWPSDLERFFVNQWSTNDWAILNLRISSERDLSMAYDMLNRNLKRRLERIDGVSRVTLYGVEKREIKINLLSDRIAAYRIDLSSLLTNLRKANFSISAGNVTDNDRRYVVRPVGELKTVEEVSNLIVAAPNIRLSDIAEITYDLPKRDYGRHLDMKYAIGVDIFKESTANTVTVTDKVMEALKEIEKQPEMSGIQLFVMMNQADGIVKSLTELLNSGLVGAAMSILVLFYFLRQVGTTLVVALSVPFSLMITLAVMYFLDMSLNVLSMMGLMLAIGMLVDNAVVVTENVHRHQMMGGNKLEATLRGVKEVSLSVTAGTLTTAIVFLPNLLSTNNEISVYLGQVALTIIISLGASLILAQTVVPLLTARLPVPKTATERKRTFIDRAEDRYVKVLEWMISHKWWAAGIIVLLVGSVAIPLQFVKQNMFESAEQRQIRLIYHLNGTYDLATVEKAVTEMEKFLYDNKDKLEVSSVYSYFEPRMATSTITLTDGEHAVLTTAQIMDSIRTRMPKLAIANPSFEWRRESGKGEFLELQLNGESSEALVEMSQEAARLLSLIPGLTDVRSEAESGEEEVHIIVDRDRAQAQGLTAQSIAQMVSVAMRGSNLPRFYSDEGEITVRIEFAGADRQSLQDLMNVPLYTPRGESIKLNSVADFRIHRGPKAIQRTNRMTTMGITMNLKGLTAQEAREKVSQVMNGYVFPVGYGWSYGQRFDYEGDTSDSMMQNTLLALALIYLVMAALFESVLYPVSIWTSIIFAVIGVWWFFLITGTAFSLMAWIGILILIGIVVNNGIVLIDYVTHLRANGFTREAAMLEAGKSRLRPIVMTAATTILGLVPLCFSNTSVGGDGPPYFPMARAIVGGLTFSTFVTILVLPNIYLMLDDLKLWTGRVIRLSAEPFRAIKTVAKWPERSLAAPDPVPVAVNDQTDSPR
jgi:HAE1 family hydrophobic/amphiphilic exporter-1